MKQDITLPQYPALITAAEVLMVASLREGMNLTSHEFIHCQDGKYSHTNHGPLILSEFMGSGFFFENRHLLVNPWNHRRCTEAINTALEMSQENESKRGSY